VPGLLAKNVNQTAGFVKPTAYRHKSAHFERSYDRGGNPFVRFPSRGSDACRRAIEAAEDNEKSERSAATSGKAGPPAWRIVAARKLPVL